MAIIRERFSSPIVTLENSNPWRVKCLNQVFTTTLKFVPREIPRRSFPENLCTRANFPKANIIVYKSFCNWSSSGISESGQRTADNCFCTNVFQTSMDFCARMSTLETFHCSMIKVKTQIHGNFYKFGYLWNHHNISNLLGTFKAETRKNWF